jgi:hypothetical protein
VSVRLRFVALIALVAALLAGCTSSSKKQQPPDGGTSASAPTGAVTASALAAKLTAGLNSLTSAHLSIDAGSLGGASTADVALDKGHATAADVHLTQSGAAVEEITVDGKSYVKVPPTSNTSKPWVLVRTSSSNPIAKALATSLNVSALITSLDVVTTLVGTASGVQDEGSLSLDGVPTTHYTMQIDPTKKTGNTRLDSLLQLLGSAKIPTDLWLDSKDRPVKFALTVTFAGAHLPVTIDVSKFDVPVHIAAPPASQVDSG